MHSKISENSITIHTPAKLNLFLEILGKRKDGFHELETVMTAVDFCDRITFSIDSREPAANDNSSSIDLNCCWDSRGLSMLDDSHFRGSYQGTIGDLPNGPNNLVYRAAQSFLKAVGITATLRIVLEKRIPSAAGLGGASANAAGTLLALDRFFETGLDATRLAEIGGALGSDIPFFIFLDRAPDNRFASGMANCQGRGEKISPVEFSQPIHFVVVRPPFGFSTAEIFSKVRVPESRRFFELSKSETGKYDWNSILFNRLQETTESDSSEIRKICLALNESGCIASQMTGSGSSCFGICEDRAHALHVANQIDSQNLGFVFTCQNLQDFSVRL